MRGFCVPIPWGPCPRNRGAEFTARGLSSNSPAHMNEEIIRMRFRLPYACMALACALVLAGCGKKEEESAPAPAANAPAATPIDAATAGSVSGTVKLDGAAPKPARLKTEADPFCSKMHTSAPL